MKNEIEQLLLKYKHGHNIIYGHNIWGGGRGACWTSKYRNPVRKFAKFSFTEPIK